MPNTQIKTLDNRLVWVWMGHLNSLHPCMDVGAGRREGEGGVVGGAAIWLSSNIDLLCLHHLFFRIDRHNISIENWDTNVFVGLAPCSNFLSTMMQRTVLWLAWFRVFHKDRYKTENANWNRNLFSITVLWHA